MSQILCTICRQSDTCDKFLAQLCGHVFCDTCTFHFSNRERKCPLCRREWGSIAPFRIYLTFPDPEKSLSILHHLGDIDENSPAILVEKASGVVKRFAEDPDVPVAHDSAMLLLDAARRLEERVTPLATKLDVLQHENEALCHRVQVLEAQLKSKDVLAADLERLNQTVMEREVTITVIRDDLSHEKQKRQSERNANRRLTRSLRKKQEEITVKEKEIDGLKSELVERDKEVSKMFSATPDDTDMDGIGRSWV
ncbi:hypothetical protein AN958_11307 [Leucoagaricus sp. SymC.cos]|nr:hypothetical protein AN958_11307 [Leucoagaricus sp. SymC.cos]